MSLLVTLNGANYIIPQTNEVGWGSNLDDYFVAIAAGVLQKTGGSFTLSAETDFGASYGLKSLYYKSRATNVAATGALRLANAETGIVWRNFLNNADLALTVNASNQLTFNGVPIQPNTLTSAHILVGNGSNIATDVAMTGDISIDNTGLTAIGAGKIVNAQINASAAIARSKLAALTVSRAMVTDGSGFDAVSATTATELGYVNGVTSAIQTQLDAKQTTTLASGNILVGNVSNVAASVAMSGDITITNAGVTAIGAGKIVNAQINAAAAIAYSKLALTGSIVNADVSASAAIAYSKLNLALSIVNADVSTSAAIAYSKLNLTGSILNADVNASAAIAYSKLALTGSIVNADVSSSAAIAITKVAIGTANQIIGTNNGATANEFKTLTATANQVSVTHGAGTVTFATPQDIGTASAVRFGSVTIGGALDASSILSLTSTSKGFLPPVMTTTQKNAISTPTDGLIVYDSSLAQLFLRTGAAWTPLSVGGGSGTVGSGTANQLAYYSGSGTTVAGLTSITASRALASDANGLPVAATTTAAELAFVNGVTSAIQTQINTKAPTASPTFTGTVTLAAGLVGSPSLTLGDSTTGWWRQALNRWSFSASGAEVARLTATGLQLSTGVLSVGDGAVGSPTMTFFNDTTSGIYRRTSNTLSFSVGGVAQAEMTLGGLECFTAALFDTTAKFADGAVATPGIIFSSQSGTGLYKTGTDSIRFANSGVNSFSVIAGGAEVETGKVINTIDKTGYQVAGTQVYPIVQIVTGGPFSGGTTTSVTYVDTLATLSITPKFNTSKIYVIVHGFLQTSDATKTVTCGLFRGSTELPSGFGAVMCGTRSTIGVPVSFSTYDSPATTSATAYKVQFKTSNVAATATWGSDGGSNFAGEGCITLIEVAQ